MTHQLVVPINQVITANQPSLLNTRKMCHVLAKQGQIEPLQVRVYHPETSDGKPATYIPFHQDAWANEIIEAARMLAWDTLLVVIKDKSEKYEY